MVDYSMVYFDNYVAKQYLKHIAAIAYPRLNPTRGAGKSQSFDVIKITQNNLDMVDKYPRTRLVKIDEE